MNVLYIILDIFCSNNFIEIKPEWISAR